MTSVRDQDASLIARIISRDEQALSELYQQYGSKVYGIALYVLKNAALAEEATQDTFMKIWDTAQRWNSQQSQLGTWIMTIARFTAIDIVRRENRHSGMSDVDEETSLHADQNDAIHNDEWDDARLLQALITRLPEEQFQAIELAFFMGMSHQEIANHLSQPLGTIKSRIRNGLQMLRGLWVLKTG